jgi:hypothetical protein
MAPPAQFVRVGVAIVVLIAVAIGLSGCTPGSPQDAADEAWNRHLRLATKDLVRDGTLVDANGSPAVSSGCRRGDRRVGLTLYDCTVTFEDGATWGGVVRVNDDGTAFIRIAVHPLTGAGAPP